MRGRGEPGDLVCTHVPDSFGRVKAFPTDDDWEAVFFVNDLGGGGFFGEFDFVADDFGAEDGACVEVEVVAEAFGEDDAAGFVEGECGGHGWKNGRDNGIFNGILGGGGGKTGKKKGGRKKEGGEIGGTARGLILGWGFWFLVRCLRFAGEIGTANGAKGTNGMCE